MAHRAGLDVAAQDLDALAAQPLADPRRRGRSGPAKAVSRATGLPLRAITTSVAALEQTK